MLRTHRWTRRWALFPQQKNDETSIARGAEPESEVSPSRAHPPSTPVSPNHSDTAKKELHFDIFDMQREIGTQTDELKVYGAEHIEKETGLVLRADAPTSWKRPVLPDRQQTILELTQLLDKTLGSDDEN